MTPPPLDELLAQQSFLRRLALRLVMDESAADDLVQDTLVLALDRSPSQPAALRAWLATSLRRLATRGRRGRRRRQARERTSARTEGTGGGLEELDRRLDAQLMVARLLRELPAVQRQVILLRQAEELTPPAISEQLGISIDIVKMRLRRGLEALRAELDRRHGGRLRFGVSPDSELELEVEVRGLASAFFDLLAPGRYLLTLALPGHRDLAQEVEVSEGEALELTVQLEWE